MRAHASLALSAFVLSTFATVEAAAQPTPQPDAPPVVPATAPPTQQPETPPPNVATEPAPTKGAGAPAAAPIDSATEQRFRTLEEENRRMRQDLERLKAAQQAADAKAEESSKGARLSGYVDFGFFVTSGDGSGIRSDDNYAHFPEYRDQGVPGQWVFYGDPLATMINARGEPADLAGSRAITFDAIHNGGHPSFILNSLNFQPEAPIVNHVRVRGSVDLLPRTRDPSVRATGSKNGGPFLGDFVDVKLAYAEWDVPTNGWKLVFEAGKVDSPFGIEPRTQDAPDRLMVTPSLICRYACGRPIGLKAKTKFFKDRLTADLAVTNGSVFTESFGFHDEIDSNSMKTITGRLAYDFHIGKKLEIGTSLSGGAQDLQTSNKVIQLSQGFDLQFQVGNLQLSGEFTGGHANGKENPGDPSCSIAPCIQFAGAYGVIAYRLFDLVTPFVRVDGRDAIHQDGKSFVYISSLMRTTSGLRFDVTDNIVVKAEYTHVQELGRAPQFANEVATSSLVVKY